MSKQNMSDRDPIDEQGPVNIVGNTIRILRGEKGWSQQLLSEKLETEAVYVCRGSISRIEEKLRKVSDRELYALSKIFGVPMEALIDREE